jgi:hypothetical protein
VNIFFDAKPIRNEKLIQIIIPNLKYGLLIIQNKGTFLTIHKYVNENGKCVPILRTTPVTARSVKNNLFLFFEKNIANRTISGANQLRIINKILV